MTDKGRCKRFSRRIGALGFAALLSFAALASCASASADKEAAAKGTSASGSGVDLKAELSSPQAANGSILVVTVNVPSELRDQAVLGEFEGIELPFFPSPDLGEGVYETVLGVPYERKPGPAQVTIKAGSGANPVVASVPVTIVEGNYKSEAIKTDSRHVNPPKRDLVRIRREVKEVAEIYARTTARKFWKGPFALPIQSSITSPFGSRRVYNGQLKHFHPGLDLKAPQGTPIHAAAPGVVVLAKNLFYTGNTVMIDHGYGVITLYAHMSKLKVKKGQEVTPRTLLGLSGMTGRATGPHLHWQCVIHKQKVNPLDLTKVMR